MSKAAVWIARGVAGAGLEAGGAAEGGGWPESCAIPKGRLKKIKAAKKLRLLVRCIVSRLGIDPKRWQPLWRKQLHFDLTPFAILHWVLWTVTEHILVA